MKSLQTEINQPAKPRDYRYWIIRIAFLLGALLLFYYGYCWGLWGRNSLLLQYIFQCGCPSASNEARYPKQVEIVIPACHYTGIRLSPSGRLLFVLEKGLWPASPYVVDLGTHEKIPFRIPANSFYFLNDDLLYVPSYQGNKAYILDRSSGKKYAIEDATHLKPSIYSNGNIDPSLLLGILFQDNQIFMIDEVFQPVIVLSPDFHTHAERSFMFDSLDFPGEETNRVEQFLQKNSVVYHYVPADFPHEVLSRNGKFIARYDGIYLVKTNQKIVEGYPSNGGYFAVRGWTYDGRGVIYSQPRSGPCLIQTNFLIFDDTACFFEVPQPVIILKVPEQYLGLAKTP